MTRNRGKRHVSSNQGVDWEGGGCGGKEERSLSHGVKRGQKRTKISSEKRPLCCTRRGGRQDKSKTEQGAQSKAGRNTKKAEVYGVPQKSSCADTSPLKGFKGEGRQGGEGGRWVLKKWCTLRGGRGSSAARNGKTRGSRQEKGENTPFGGLEIQGHSKVRFLSVRELGRI